jgi:molybdopterin-binding protein
LSADKDETSNVNRLKGVVIKIDQDSENAKVVVDIGNHDTVVSVQSQNVIEKMGVGIGSSVVVTIKANDIILGR